MNQCRTNAKNMIASFFPPKRYLISGSKRMRENGGGSTKSHNKICTIQSNEDDRKSGVLINLSQPNMAIVNEDSRLNIKKIEDEYNSHCQRRDRLIRMRLVENSDINIHENDVDPYSIQKKKNRRPQSAKVDNIQSKFKTEKHKIVLKLQRAFKNELQDINNSDISILSTKLNKRNIRDQNSSNSFARKYFAPTPSKRIDTINSTVNNSQLKKRERELSNNSFACSNDTNKIVNKCIEMYNKNGVPRRTRPATAKVKGHLNSNLAGIDELKDFKQQILNDDKYSTYSKIPSEVSKSSAKMSKFLYKPYVPNYKKFANKRKSVNTHSSRGEPGEMYSKIGDSEKNKRVYHNSNCKTKSFTLSDNIFIL